MMTSAQHLETTFAIGTCLEMVVASRSVTASIARLNMVDFAVASCCSATFTGAAVLRSSFGRGAGEAPNVVALPGATTCVAAPRATTCSDDLHVAPLATTGFALPCREVAGDPFGDERR